MIARRVAFHLSQRRHRTERVHTELETFTLARDLKNPISLCRAARDSCSVLLFRFVFHRTSQHDYLGNGFHRNRFLQARCRAFFRGHKDVCLPYSFPPPPPPEEYVISCRKRPFLLIRWCCHGDGADILSFLLHVTH